jgi:hypothetical protein
MCESCPGTRDSTRFRHVDHNLHTNAEGAAVSCHHNGMCIGLVLPRLRLGMIRCRSLVPACGRSMPPVRSPARDPAERLAGRLVGPRCQASGSSPGCGRTPTRMGSMERPPDLEIKANVVHLSHAAKVTKRRAECEAHVAETTTGATSRKECRSLCHGPCAEVGNPWHLQLGDQLANQLSRHKRQVNSRSA